MARTWFGDLLGAAVGAAVLFGMAAAASAQALQPATGVDSTWFIGGGGGLAAVQNVGGLVSVEVGWHQSRSLDLIGEAVWLQDTVTRRRLDTAASLAAHLQATQGKAASATLDAPASSVIGQARWAFGSGRLHPYVSGGGGVSRVTLRPSVTMAGEDITDRLEEFGVTLGSDLTGTSYRPTATVGLGVLIGQGRWTLDGGIRLISIFMTDQTTNAITAKAGVAYGF